MSKVDVVVLGRDGFFHEWLVEDSAIHLYVVIKLLQLTLLKV